jgi:hypothetical protein
LPAFTVLSLPVAVIQPSFQAVLVPSVGAPPLTLAGLLATLRAAVTVSAITVRADEENRVTLWAQANALPQNDFAILV